MQGLILAAGMGKRLKELTHDNTKCMVKVNGIPLIERTLNQLSSAGLARTIIVVGYKGDALRKFVGHNWKGMRVDYVENPIYDKTNNIYSLALAADEMCKDDTILLESDIIFDDSVLDRVLSSKKMNLAVVDAWQTWMDGTVVTLGKDNVVDKFVPKCDFDYSFAKAYYKTVNIYKFSKEFSGNDYVPFLKAYSRSLGNNEYYEQVLRIVTLLGKTNFHGLLLRGEKWYEIDDEQDLDIAESMFCSPEEQVKRLSLRYGGYWRYPGMKDFCYLVTPYFPTDRLRHEIINSFNSLMESYPSGQKVNALIAAKTFGLAYSQVAVGNGAAEIINAYMEMCRGNVGFVYPTFEEYPNRIPEKRRVVFCAPSNSGFRYSYKSLKNFFTGKGISNLVIINPDNPSGNFISRNDMDKIVAWTREEKIRLLVDESFMDFADQSYSLLERSFLDVNRHVSVVKSISKSYGVPGFRLGIIASSDSRLMNKIRSRLSIWNINSFGEYFMQIIEKYKKEYLNGCKLLSEERSRFVQKLRRIKHLKVYPSAANFVLCKVLPPYTPHEMAIYLWDRYRMLIKDCSNKKGFKGYPYIRLAIRCSEDNDALTQAIHRYMTPCR